MVRPAFRLLKYKRESRKKLDKRMPYEALLGTPSKIDPVSYRKRFKPKSKNAEGIPLELESEVERRSQAFAVAYPGRQAHQPAVTSELSPRACAACLPFSVLRSLYITVDLVRCGIPGKQVRQIKKSKIVANFEFRPLNILD